METIRDIYTEINLGYRDLGRRIYSFSEIRKAPIKDDGSLSSTLLLKMRKEEREEDLRSEAPVSIPVHDTAYDEYTSSLSPTSESFRSFAEREASEEAPAPEEQGKKPKRRLNRLRAKISDTVFDYSEIEQEKIEQEIDNLVNSDGYYNEVEPRDIDVDYKEVRQINKPALIAAGVLLIYTIIILLV